MSRIIDPREQHSRRWLVQLHDDLRRKAREDRERRQYEADRREEARELEASRRRYRRTANG